MSVSPLHVCGITHTPLFRKPNSFADLFCLALPPTRPYTKTPADLAGLVTLVLLTGLFWGLCIEFVKKGDWKASPRKVKAVACIVLLFSLFCLALAYEEIIDTGGERALLSDPFAPGSCVLIFPPELGSLAKTVDG